MNKRIALCLDERSCCEPQLIGLDGERLDAQGWLEVFVEGVEARSSIGERREIEEAWVVSCDDVDPINLAATLKADRPELCVRLVTAEGCGSLFSRAHMALIDEVVDQSAFLRLYAQAKERLSGEVVQTDDSAGGDAPEMADAGASVVAEPVTREAAHEVRFAMPQRDNRVPTHARQPQEAPSPLVAPAQRRGFVMPVVSGSGGAGKSSVSVVAAHVAKRRGFKVLLLDYDLQFGDVASMAGVDNPLAIDVAIAHPDQFERECARDEALVVLAAPERLETAEEVVRGLPSFLDGLAGRFDVIIANTGAAWAEQHAALLERSSVALFLIDQRMSSVHACRHALELCARCGIASGPFQFAVNRCAKGAPLTSIDVSCALQGAPVFELKDGGRDVEECLSGGAVDDLFEMENEFVSSVAHMMDRLLPGSAASEGAERANESRRSLLRRGRHAGRRRGRRSS